jgi:DNA (cytosine-5)-methyltransferase 1
LWPSFYGLIAECKPSIIFGEQVASKDGREWLSAVRLDLEDAGYAVGAANLSAASVGAPHERQRHFFVADASGGQQRQEVEGRKSRNGEMGSLAANGIGADAAGRHTNGRRIGSHEEMEEDRPIAYRHEARRADGQMESRLRASEVTLHRCAFVEEWQGWNGGFSGFGRVDDGVSSRMAKSVVGGFGNAIVPQVAQAFIEAFMEVRP